MTEQEKQEVYEYALGKLKSGATNVATAIEVESWKDLDSLPATNKNGEMVRVKTNILDDAVKGAREATEKANASAAKAEEAAVAHGGFTTLIALNMGATGFLEAYNDKQVNPEPIATFGDKEFLKNWGPILIQCDNYSALKVRLKKNNFLQYKDRTGIYAPVVGITEEQRKQCDVELYLDSNHTQKYCDARKFDATAFWKKYKNTQKLYDKDGKEISHILRPWETTSTKNSVFIACFKHTDARTDIHPLWLVDNMKGATGKVWKGILAEDTPKVWDGFDVSKWRLAPTGIAPCPSTSIGNKLRQFFFLYNTGDPNTNGSAGHSGCSKMFYNIGRTFPRTTDMNQQSVATMARANNNDPTSSYPVAEGGYHALNTFITSMECLFGTKNLYKADLFGSGISSNDDCRDEATWKNNGGVRYRKKGESAWKYVRWDNNSHDIYINNAGKRVNMSQTINYERPKEQCMESQMAASYAAELGIAENTPFEFYGSTYRYVNVPGGEGLLDGGMDVRVYKVVSATINAFNADKTAQQFDVECNLRMSLINGVNLSGDMFAYWGGGCEFVEEKGNIIKAYIEPDQKKWLNETETQKADGSAFDFEKEYEHIADRKAVSNPALTRHGYSPLLDDGSRTGEYFYSWLGNSAVKDNIRVRDSIRFRGNAIRSACAPRTLNAQNSCDYKSGSDGGSMIFCFGN